MADPAVPNAPATIDPPPIEKIYSIDYEAAARKTTKALLNIGAGDAVTTEIASINATLSLAAAIRESTIAIVAAIDRIGQRV